MLFPVTKTVVRTLVMLMHAAAVGVQRNSAIDDAGGSPRLNRAGMGVPEKAVPVVYNDWRNPAGTTLWGHNRGLGLIHSVPQVVARSSSGDLLRKVSDGACVEASGHSLGAIVVLHEAFLSWVPLEQMEPLGVPECLWPTAKELQNRGITIPRVVAIAPPLFGSPDAAPQLRVKVGWFEVDCKFQWPLSGPRYLQLDSRYLKWFRGCVAMMAADPNGPTPHIIGTPDGVVAPPWLDMPGVVNHRIGFDEELRTGHLRQPFDPHVVDRINAIFAGEHDPPVVPQVVPAPLLAA